jgi:hypothetical protein
MIESLIKYILSKLAGITAQQWSSALLWVLNTARSYKDEDGATKRERVISVLKKQFPNMSNGNMLTLIQTAWAWLNFKKKI